MAASENKGKIYKFLYPDKELLPWDKEMSLFDLWRRANQCLEITRIRHVSWRGKAYINRIRYQFWWFHYPRRVCVVFCKGIARIWLTRLTQMVIVSSILKNLGKWCRRINKYFVIVNIRVTKIYTCYLLSCYKFI